MSAPRTLGWQLSFAAYIFGYWVFQTGRALAQLEGEGIVPFPMTWKLVAGVFIVLNVIEIVYTLLENPAPKKEVY